jgi:hypothetical protein
MIQQKRWFPFLTVVLSSILLVTASCDKDDDDGPQTQFSLTGNASGAQEVPAVTTPGTGTLNGSYDNTTNLLTYNITWTNLKAAPTMMHFHGPAAVGANASPVVNITNFTAAASGSATGTATLTDAQEMDLMNGLWYYNIHTPPHTGGEIRAQVIVD